MKAKTIPETELQALNLTRGQFDNIEDSLANDEMSSDEEMVQHWKSLEIPDTINSAAIELRPTFLTDPFAGLSACNGKLAITYHPMKAKLNV